MSEQNSRNYSLDLLRGIAALGIVLFHVLGPYFHQLRSLYFFVDFFFVLSGFVLSRAVELNSWPAVKSFAKHRAKRIFPMSVSALCFAEFIRIAPSLLHRQESLGDIPNLSKETLNFFVALLLLQVFSHSSQLLLFPLWSLSAEWLTNLGAASTRRLIGKWQIYLFVFTGFALLATGLFSKVLDSPSEWVVNLGRCMLCFGTGQIIFKLIQVGTHQTNSRIHLIIATLLVIFYYLILNRFGSQALIFAPLPFGYIVWVFGSRDHTICGGRIRRLSIQSGRYSYGIYVWHIPALGVCDIALNLSGKGISHQILLNVYELSGTLLLSFFLTYIVLKYVERAPLTADRLNSSGQESK